MSRRTPAADGPPAAGHGTRRRTRDIERGSIGEQHEASGAGTDDLVRQNRPPRALRLPAPEVPPVDPTAHERLTLARADHFSEKTSASILTGDSIGFSTAANPPVTDENQRRINSQYQCSQKSKKALPPQPAKRPHRYHEQRNRPYTQG